MENADKLPAGKSLKNKEATEQDPGDSDHEEEKENRVDDNAVAPKIERDSEVDPNKKVSYTYNAERVIGHGSFGIVFVATIAETGHIVAIKKVL